MANENAPSLGSAPAVAPSATSAPVSAPSPAPAEPTASAVSQSPAPESVPETVLGSEPKPVAKTEKPADKPAEKALAKDAAPVETQAETSPVDQAPLPAFEPWKFPEGVQTDAALVADFNKELGEFANTVKADSKTMQAFGQKLIDRHVAEVQSVAEKLAAVYNKVWQDQTRNWYQEFLKDPEIGGEKKDASIASAQEFIRRHGGSEENQKTLRDMFKQTGIGNHPELIRLFARANSALREPKAVPAQSPPPTQAKSRTQKFYGSKT